MRGGPDDVHAACLVPIDPGRRVFQSGLVSEALPERLETPLQDVMVVVRVVRVRQRLEYLAVDQFHEVFGQPPVTAGGRTGRGLKHGSSPT